MHNYLSTHLLEYDLADLSENKLTCLSSCSFFRLTTNTYLSPQLPVYMPIHVPVYDLTCSFSYFHSDQPIRSTRQSFYCSTCPQMYLFISKPVQFIFIFRHNMHNDLSNHLLRYLRTDSPENRFTYLPSCFSFV